MKANLAHILPFVFAFLVVTGGLVYLNSQYENIFQLNFSPRGLNSSMQDSTKAAIDSLKSETLNSPAPFDTLSARSALDSLIRVYKTKSGLNEISELKNDSTLTDSINAVTELLKITSPAKIDSSRNLVKTINQPESKTKPDEEYLDWIKKISSIYEAMEPRKAAKIIQNYSDNVARDILYTMKKKTAAKVIAELSPETVNRIIRFQ